MAGFSGMRNGIPDIMRTATMVSLWLGGAKQGGDLLKKATACSGSRRLITKIGEFVLKYSS